jgi:hypothetical protein
MFALEPAMPAYVRRMANARAMLTAMLTIDASRRVLVSAERGLALIAAARSATVEVSDGLMPRVFKCPGGPFDPSALVLVKPLPRHKIR